MIKYIKRIDREQIYRDLRAYFWTRKFGDATYGVLEEGTMIRIKVKYDKLDVDIIKVSDEFILPLKELLYHWTQQKYDITVRGDLVTLRKVQ